MSGRHRRGGHGDHHNELAANGPASARCHGRSSDGAAEPWARALALQRPERKLRAGVFGANDGLVSNLSLVMGVAGAHPGASVVLLSGVAGLLAGAFSMAAGEYISVRTQRERYEHLLSIERRELIEDPEEEQAELAAIYTAKGIPQQDAERIAEHLIRDPEAALDTMAREELGLNPQDLGLPVTAAASSFLMFAIGAILPVLPYLFLAEGAAFIAAAMLGAAGLQAVGGRRLGGDRPRRLDKCPADARDRRHRSRDHVRRRQPDRGIGMTLRTTYAVRLRGRRVLSAAAL